MAKSLDFPVSTETNETLVGVTATATSSAAVLSCAACCVLPLALPAALLAGTGATLGWLESASPWLRLLSLVIVAAAWLMIWRQSVRTGKRAARSTIILLGLSTVLTVISLLWEPFLKRQWSGFFAETSLKTGLKQALFHRRGRPRFVG